MNDALWVYANIYATNTGIYQSKRKKVQYLGQNFLYVCNQN